MSTILNGYGEIGISTHALHEEGDSTFLPVVLFPGISTHALHEEGDHRHPPGLRQAENFYPRPPRGGRPELAAALSAAIDISTHALHEEGDQTVLQCGTM